MQFGACRENMDYSNGIGARSAIAFILPSRISAHFESGWPSEEPIQTANKGWDGGST